MRGRMARVGVLAALGVLGLVGCDTVTRITASTYQDGVRCFAPALSGDGRFVAFTSLDDPSGVTQPQASVRRELATGASTKLAGQPSSVAPNGISADGSRVVFTISFSDGDLGAEDRAYLWTRYSGTRTRISPLGEDLGEAAISPDGRKVAYTEGNLKRLWLHDVGTGGRRAIALPGGTTGAQWVDLDLSATGRYLAMRRVDVDAIWVLDLQGSGAWTFGGGDETAGLSAPSITDDGRYVAYAQSELATLPKVRVWDRSLQKTTTLATAGGQFISDPVISGDGSRVAAVQPEIEGPSSLVLFDRASGKGRRGLTADAPISHLSISRDGRAVALCSRASNLAPGPVAPNLFLWRG